MLWEKLNMHMQNKHEMEPFPDNTQRKQLQKN